MKKSYNWVVAIGVVVAACIAGTFVREYFDSRNVVQNIEPIDIESVDIDEEIQTADDNREVYIKKVNLNTATIEQLCELPKIGEKTAMEIIEFRNAYGSFTKVEEIKLIDGIGEKTYAQIRDYLTVE